MNSQLRKFLRNVFLNTIGEFRTPTNDIHILNGHAVCWGIPSTEDKEIAFKLLDKLHKKVEYIDFQEAVYLIENKVKPKSPLVAFTFDDGLLEQYTHIAPILDFFHVKGAFFINPNFVDGNVAYLKKFTESVIMNPSKLPMNWEQIIDLHKRGHVIGAHTMDHYMINSYDNKELEYQFCECKSVIEDKLKSRCDYFAFPFGRLEQANQMSIDFALQVYKYVFSQSDYKNYFSYSGKVINRRHFETFWPYNHVNYFLSSNKSY